MADVRRILVVEDDEDLLYGLQDRLESEGYHVTPARDGIEALTRASSRNFDCIVLDVALPRRNGLEVCRDLRERNDATPILMLTARNDVNDRVRGLRIGADDYMGKPFSPMELVARIGALLRRTPRSRTAEQYSGGGLVIDFNSGTADVRGVRVELSKMELKLLQYLVEHRTTVVSREELLEKVWGHATTLATRTVDVHIATLRQKLEVDPARPELVVTVHRAGYKFSG